MSRYVRTLCVALLATALVLGACSRERLDDSESAGTTRAPGTSVEPGTTIEPSTDTTATLPTESTPSTTDASGEDDVGPFGHTEAELAAFRAAYAEAFRAECQRIWTSMGGGALADPDFPEDQYTVNDCLAELDDSWGEFADSLEEAQVTGIDDAQIAASDLADPLCRVDDPTVCWSYGD